MGENNLTWAKLFLPQGNETVTEEYGTASPVGWRRKPATDTSKGSALVHGPLYEHHDSLLPGAPGHPQIHRSPFLGWWEGKDSEQKQLIQEDR